MFSRAAKSVVKSCGSRWIHIGEKNFKIALIDDAGGISQTLSQLLRNSAKLNAVALYNVSAVNKPLPNYYFFNGQPISSEALTMPQKCCSGEGSCSNAAKQTENNNHQGNDGKSQTEKLVEALYRLPIAEEAPAFNSPLIPIEEIVPKAGNTCGRMHLYVRVLGKRGSSMKTWQRNYATPAGRKRLLDSTYPSFQKYNLNFVPEAKITKKHRTNKKTKKIDHSSCNALTHVKENDHQSLSTSLLNHDEKSARRFMKKFKNVRGLPNVETYCRAVEKSIDWMIPAALSNNKLRLLREFYSHIRFPLSSLNFTNKKRENNRVAVLFNRDSETMTGDTLNVVEQENWIQRTRTKIKSILPDLHAKIRLRSTAASDSYCLENIFAVNQMIPFSDIISNRAILFAPKDCEDDKPKPSIRKRVEEFCKLRKRTLKDPEDEKPKAGIREKIQKLYKQRKGTTLEKDRDKNDICKKRERSCKTRERIYQKKEETCGRKKIDCSERIKRAERRQNIVCGKERRSPRDCRKTRERKTEIQEDQCRQKKDDTFRREDLCKDRKSTRDCRKTRERKAEIQEDPCQQKKEDNMSRTEEDPCREQRPVKPEQTCYKLHDAAPCRLDKKEEIKEKEVTKKKEDIKKPDCSEIKKVDPCEKKTCPSVKKVPECSEDDVKRKDS
ncbi:uncharacterized protein LOC118644599 [Monomorium pharaonis]|uniref:uncharacterized protein LOC118644599 n=1 Tax=Monomorium pharaonis TaxID=307658 RepID=UPI0017478D78|nr:uncharacterized protein LOC118644599 [Monomorium pharaonis]